MTRTWFLVPGTSSEPPHWYWFPWFPSPYRGNQEPEPVPGDILADCVLRERGAWVGVGDKSMRGAP